MHRQLTLTELIHHLTTVEGTQLVHMMSDDVKLPAIDEFCKLLTDNYQCILYCVLECLKNRVQFKNYSEHVFNVDGDINVKFECYFITNMFKRGSKHVVSYIRIYDSYNLICTLITVDIDVTSDIEQLEKLIIGLDRKRIIGLDRKRKRDLIKATVDSVAKTCLDRHITNFKQLCTSWELN